MMPFCAKGNCRRLVLDAQKKLLHVLRNASGGGAPALAAAPIVPTARGNNM